MSRIVSLTPAVFHLPDAVNAVSRAYGAQPIVPRGPAFAPLLASVREGIVSAAGASDHEAVLLTGTGSTAMAAVLGSCLDPKERLVCVRNGAYGDRILEFARTLGQPVVDLQADYGARPDLDRVDALLARGEADAVAMVYGATTSCSLNPLAELGAICKARGKKLLVDGVSALFVEPMDLDGWGIAAVMGSCNKGLHAHPNLTTCVVRRDLLAEMRSIPQRVPSLELAKLHAAQVGGSHPYTIDPMSLLQVRAALDVLAAEGGVAGRNAIYRERARVLRDGYAALGLEIATWPGMPLSSIGTALRIPAGHSYVELAKRLAGEPVDDTTFEIYAAQGKLSSDLFRIFHMGHYELGVYEVFLRSLARVLGRG